jgi:hypothetical protein
MKYLLRSFLGTVSFVFVMSFAAKGQTVTNNSSATLNFSVVIGNCADAGTYDFTLSPKSSRTWSSGGSIVSSTVSDGLLGYTVYPNDHIIVPLAESLKDIECTKFHKTVWDHEEL